MSKTHSAMFRARVTLGTVEDGEINIEVWDDELTPVAMGWRPIRDWVYEHLSNWDRNNFATMFEINDDGIYEIVFQGKITGYRDYYGEYDEEVDIVDSLMQKLPDDFFEQVTIPTQKEPPHVD